MSRNDNGLKPVTKVENVVATAMIHVAGTSGNEGPAVDLNVVARKHQECEYNPKRFPGLVMRIEEPKATVLLFSTGKMVITGLRSEADAMPALKRVIHNLDKASIKVEGFPEYTVQNIVASGNLNSIIDLNKASVVMDNSIYEPEVFPGLVFRIAEPKCCFIIFSTGKFVCTGAKTVGMVEEASGKLAVIVRDLNLYQDSTGAETAEFI